MSACRFVFELLGWIWWLVLTALWVVTLVVVWPLGVVLNCLICCRWRKSEKTAPACKPPTKEQAKFRVAIIGAGWTGLECAQQLMAKGVHVQVFEQNDDVGGTWHPKSSYHSLHLHCPLWINEFQDFPHKDHDAKYLVRLSAPEVQTYLSSFAKHHGLHDFISFNTKVTELHHETTTRQAVITTIDPRNNTSTSTTTHGPFDLVLLATFACVPVFPCIQNQESFRGEIIHSSQLKSEKFMAICNENKKVIVLGANKSGTDCVIMFARAGYKNVTWLFRKSYMFVNYDCFIHSSPESRSVAGTIRGFFGVLGLTLALLSQTAAAVFLRMIGFLTCPVSPHFDFKKFHFGTMDSEQQQILRKSHFVEGEPISYTNHGLRLTNGQELTADVIVCATGYATGLLDLKVFVDNAEVVIDGDAALFQHSIVPHVPTLSLGGPALYTFGPRRGATQALHIWHYLNTRPSPHSMQRSADRNVLKQSANVALVFNGKRSFVQMWLLFYVDLIRTGVLSCAHVVRHVVGVFAGNWQISLRLKEPQMK